MALDAQYFVTSDLDTYFVDKDSGLPLAGGFLTFYRDVARNTPKTVYQLTGAPPNYSYVALPNPVKLSSVGTVQDSGGDNVVIYYFPYDDEGNLDLYYVTCTDSMAVPQFTREAWPNISSGSTPIGSSGIVQNQIANPQFSQVFINENQSTVYTVSAATNQVFAFAPDWDFVISGTGTVTIEQIPVSGNQNIVTSPPYVLDIALSPGITTCNLRQRFNVNSGLWASTASESIFLSGTLIAENQNAGSSGIQMFYAASSGGSPIMIVDEAFDNSGYLLIMGGTTEALPLSTDTNMGDDGYVDIYLSFLLNSHVRISSIQVAPITNPIGLTLLSYDNNSSNREQAYMGDYYIPRLNSRPAASLLTAWDFPLNPFQFAVSGNLTNSAGYICDQTIGFAGSSGDVAFSQDTVTNGLALTTAGSNDAFYLMQYLSGPQAQKLLGTTLSVNVFGYVTSMSNAVTMSVYLFRGSSSATIPTLPTSIGTLATNGVFTLAAADWDEIPQSGLPTSQATLPTVSTDSDIDNLDNDMGFTGWQIVDNTDISDTQYFAIVVTFAYIDTDTDITINSISLIPSDIPARPAPQSLSQVVSDCQYYYEKSADLGGYPASGTANGVRIVQMVPFINGSLVYGAYPLSFSIVYNTRKRTPLSGTPITPTLYAIDGTINSVLVRVYDNATLENSGDAAISHWSATIVGQTGVLFRPGNLATPILSTSAGASVPTTAEALILFQFIADARLGII